MARGRAGLERVTRSGKRGGRAAGSSRPAEASRLALLCGFASIYLIWGSTYLVIRFAIESLPPLLMSGVRFTLAGTAMYFWARVNGVAGPRGGHWVPAARIGALMLLFGAGGTAWAEQWVPSGAAALIVAVGPVWMVLVDWIWYGAEGPGPRVLGGLLLGLGGMTLLIGPEQLAGGGRIDPLGAGVILLGTITWAFGSLYSRDAELPESPVLATGMEMLAGGALLLLAGTLIGEWERFVLAQVTLRSLLALLYLAVFGSIVALSTYLWLLKIVSASRVVTHAYVNPIVAVFLGWWLADEPLTPRTLLAAAVIIGGVLLIVSRRKRPRVPAVEPEHV